MPRRLGIVLVALASALVLVNCTAVASGAAPKKVYVERDIVNQELAFRPHAIGLSADGTFAMTGIRYTGYGGAVATAAARAYLRGCTPDCARGKVFRPQASLRLGAQVQCRGVTIYSKLHYALQGPLPADFRRQGTELLRPVGEDGC